MRTLQVVAGRRDDHNDQERGEGAGEAAATQTGRPSSVGASGSWHTLALGSRCQSLRIPRAPRGVEPINLDNVPNVFASTASLLLASHT